MKEKKKYYFLGIGGIGMSALADYFITKNFQVAGYDRTPSPITHRFENKGIEITYNESVEAIPAWIKDSKKEVTIIYTPAIPRNHPQLMYFNQQGYEILKRSEMLEKITADKKTIAVAGTHGKTTTTAMIGHLLRQSGVDCCVFAGGIMKNYNSNFLAPEDENNAYYVVEADEFDRSFLRLNPWISVITSIEPDHLDIYRTENELKKNFALFAQKTQKEGFILMNDSVVFEEVGIERNYYTYGLSSSSDFILEQLVTRNKQLFFGIRHKSIKHEELLLKTGGNHNALNAIAALSVFYLLTGKFEPALQHIQTFEGIQRRFDIVFQSDIVVYIDDYAHHPTEIKTTLESVKKLFPGKKITAIFQPHLYSRTRDLMDGFAKVLSIPEVTILLEIYPAREEPIPGICSKVLLEKINSRNKLLLQKEEVLEYVQKEPLEVLLTIGAGDIDRLVEPIKNILTNRF